MYVFARCDVDLMQLCSAVHGLLGLNNFDQMFDQISTIDKLFSWLDKYEYCKQPVQQCQNIPVPTPDPEHVLAPGFTAHATAVSDKGQERTRGGYCLSGDTKCNECHKYDLTECDKCHGISHCQRCGCDNDRCPNNRRCALCDKIRKHCKICNSYEDCSKGCRNHPPHKGQEYRQLPRQCKC
jgi:hypothetical protein